MSILFGIVSNKNHALNQERFIQLKHSVNVFPNDRCTVIETPQYRCGVLLKHHHPQSQFEQMPQAVASAQLIFNAQGRIDNREELAKDLNLLHTNNLSDTEIILQSYLVWGRNCLDKLIGDWSFVAFHTDRNELFFGRDHHGYTSLYYYVHADFIIFSSSLKSLSRCNFIPTQVHEDKICSLILALPYGDVNGSNTYFKHIHCVPPASYLAIEKNPKKLTQRRYWFPENIAVINGRTPVEHAQGLFEVFKQAVSDRMRCHVNVASMLSGGLDSGAVVSVAARLLDEQASRLTTLSHIPIYNECNVPTHQFVNERPHMQAVVDYCGNIDASFLDSSHITPLQGIKKYLEMGGGPIFGASNAFWLYDIASTVTRLNCDVLLTGECGNGSISHKGVMQLLPCNLYCSQVGLLRTVKNKLLNPFFNQSSTQIKNLKLDKQNRLLALNASTLDKNKLQSGIEHQLEQLLVTSRIEHALQVIMPDKNPRCNNGAMISQFFGIDLRDPTADKRVIDYSLSIPNELFFGQGHYKTKQVFKLMMKGMLPEKVLYETRKGVQSSDIKRRIMDDKVEIEKILSQLNCHPTAQHFINVENLTSRWEQIQSKRNSNQLTGGFLSHLMTGLFLMQDT